MLTYWQYRGGISDYSADFTATDSSEFSLNCPAMYGWLIEFDRNPACLYVRVALRQLRRRRSKGQLLRLPVQRDSVVLEERSIHVG